MVYRSSIGNWKVVSMIDDQVKANMPLDRLWTVEEVAEYLRLKPATIRRMAREGKIPAIKVGKSWRFSENQILIPPIQLITENND